MMLERPTKPRQRARQQTSAERRRARQRAYRKRLRESRVIVSVEVDAATLDLLLRLGWLRERDAADRQAVGAAIAELLRATKG